MQQEDMISANEFCIHYNLELSFIHSLRDYGLIETVVVEDNLFFHSEQLEFLEKIIRLHYELDINLEGIQTIIHLLQRMEKMQEEILHLTNSLKAHEPD